MKHRLKIPFLLNSYLITEMLAPFFASFIIMNGVFLLVKLIPFLNFALELSIGPADFLRLFSYMFPNIFLYTLPMSSMMGLVIGFSRLSNDSEILALKASGISIYKILPSVVAFAAIVALFTSYFSVKLIPVSEIAMKQLTYQLLKERINKGIKEYTFTEALGDLVVHVGTIDDKTGEWKNVWVSDMRGQVKPTITMASTGKMVSDIERMNITIVLENGSLHRPDDTNAQIVKFENYTINIPLQLPSTDVNSVHRGTLNMTQLKEASAEYGLDTERGRVMLVEYHQRLVLPVGCLILTLLALPLGLQAGPGKRAIGIPIGLAVFILYYAIYTMAKMYAKDGHSSITLLMWLPNVLWLFVTLFSIYRVTYEKPLIPRPVSGYLSRRVAAISGPCNIVFTSVYTHIKRLLPNREKILPYHRRRSHTGPRVIRGDVRHRLYHFPECSDYDGEHCSLEFKNAQVAEDGGFAPCDFCRTIREKQDEAGVDSATA